MIPAKGNFDAPRAQQRSQIFGESYYGRSATASAEDTLLFECKS